MILQTGGTSDASRFCPHSHALQYRHTNPLSSLHLTPSRPGVAIFEDWTCRIFYKQQSSTKMYRVTNFYPRHTSMTGRYWSPCSDVGCGIACRIEHAYHSPRSCKQQPSIEMAQCNQQPSIEMTRLKQTILTPFTDVGYCQGLVDKLHDDFVCVSLSVNMMQRTAFD